MERVKIGQKMPIDSSKNCQHGGGYRNEMLIKKFSKNGGRKVRKFRIKFIPFSLLAQLRFALLVARPTQFDPLMMAEK